MRRPGFTLIEALVAITVTAMAASALLLGVTASVATTEDAERRTIAQGLANQALDEVLGARYMELHCSPHDTQLQPGGAEKATGTRELFDDIDDYNNWKAGPPVDRWGIELGKDDGTGGERHKNFWAPDGTLHRWTRTIHVDYVDEADLENLLPDSQPTDYRAVEVRVYYDDPQSGPIEMARARRIVAHVPPYDTD